MATMQSDPIIFVVGETASGKSQLALHLAQLCNGEIISADALAVYRKCDIGTAKPNAEELASVPHHCINCFDPDQHCDVSHWYDLAEQARCDILQRGRIPIVAGGSPLYTKSMLEGLSTGAPRDPEIRDQLQAEYDRIGGEAMLARLNEVDPTYASERHANDAKRIIRALEVYQLTGQPFSSFHTTDGKRRPELSTLIIGLRWDKELIHRRINARVKHMIANGLVDEVASLQAAMCLEAAQGVGYKEIIGYLNREYDLDHAQYLVQRNTRQLAKQQRTWYKRWRDIRWIETDRQLNHAI